MKKAYLMRRPDDDDDDYYMPKETVHAKPINERYAKTLGTTYQGRDFVKASDKSQKDFYGTQTVLGGGDLAAKADEAPSTSGAAALRPLTHDERNKISARIIKAELKQDKELVKKLKQKLEYGLTGEGNGASSAKNSSPSDEKTVLLMKMDKKSGLVMPARSEKSSAAQPSVKDVKKSSKTVDDEFNRTMGLGEMVADEKRTTSADQLSMFGRAAKMCSENGVDDDWVVDDNIMSHPKKRRHEEKDTRQNASKRVKEHKTLERTLESCKRCIDSRHLQKHAIVAMGTKAYLAVVPWEGLADEHCYVAPMAHYASQVLLDEDVHEEMQQWLKSLTAMWMRENKADAGDEDDDEKEDCVFFESAKNVNQQGHMVVECVPLPKEVGELAPIYFKKAIMDSEKEWSDNKKLIDLGKAGGSVRRAVPKGFPYFAVNFGLQPGYAHVIENEDHFPANFAHEIIGGMLDLSHKTWRNVRQLSLDEIKQKRDRMRERWLPYNWTQKKDNQGEE